MVLLARSALLTAFSLAPARGVTVHPHAPPPRQGAARQVSTGEGHEFAKRHGCLFVETSAKTNVAVAQVCVCVRVGRGVGRGACPG